jgi:hypothetical protein
MEEHVFCDCKLYKEQRATKTDMLSEKIKKEYPQSVTELLRLEGKGFLQCLCNFINEIPQFI